MKKRLISIAWSLIPFAITLILVVNLFSLSVVAVAVIVAIISVYGGLMALSWKNSARAKQLQISSYSYNGSKGKILKIALCVSSPFGFLLLLISLIPVEHYSIWMLVIFPAMVMFCMPLAVVADFCREFRVSSVLFWVVQMLIQFACVGAGRVLSLVLIEIFS